MVDQSNITAVGTVDVCTPAFTYSQTARVRITGPTGLSKITRCVMDGRSQSSFITDTLIKDPKLRTIKNRELNVSAFESQPAPPSRRRIVWFNVRGFGQIVLSRSVPLRARTCVHRSRLSGRKSESWHIAVDYSSPNPKLNYMKTCTSKSSLVATRTERYPWC